MGSRCRLRGRQRRMARRCSADHRWLAGAPRLSRGGPPGDRTQNPRI